MMRQPRGPAAELWSLVVSTCRCCRAAPHIFRNCLHDFLLDTWNTPHITQIPEMRDEVRRQIIWGISQLTSPAAYLLSVGGFIVEGNIWMKSNKEYFLSHCKTFFVILHCHLNLNGIHCIRSIDPPLKRNNKLFYRDISEGFELATSTEKYKKILNSVKCSRKVWWVLPLLLWGWATAAVPCPAHAAP